jgi:hypothetical protein
MATKVALRAVPKGGTTEPSKKQRERIVLIETPPRPDSFIQTTTATGRRVWYLRFEVTGMNPRLFGPFSSKRDCLLFLDEALNAMADFEGEVMEAYEKRVVREECHKIWPPIVEHPMLDKLHSPRKKGGDR